MHKYKLNIVFVIFCYARYFVFKLISCELYDDTYFLYFFTIILGFNCKFLPQHSAHEIRKWHSCHEKLRCIVKPSKIALNLFSFRQRDILTSICITQSWELKSKKVQLRESVVICTVSFKKNLIRLRMMTKYFWNFLSFIFPNEEI